MLTISLVLFSQEEDNGTPKRKRPYQLRDVSFQYSGAIFNFNSSYLNHMHDLYDYTSPKWTNMDSTTIHNNRSEIYGKLCFQKRLGDNTSSFYGNIYLGIGLSFGDRLDAAYISNYHIHLDNGEINSFPVTNIDTTIILQKEYIHSSTDLGFDIAYTIGSSPKNTFTSEFGFGISTLYSIFSEVSVIDLESTLYSYVDKFDRINSFDNLNREANNYSAASQLVVKAYVPIILSYKLNRSGSFALTTMFSGGVELQKPAKSQFYAYPYFTIGIGCRFKL